MSTEIRCAALAPLPSKGDRRHPGASPFYNLFRILYPQVGPWPAVGRKPLNKLCCKNNKNNKNNKTKNKHKHATKRCAV